MQRDAEDGPGAREPESRPAAPPARASDRERDTAVQRLQVAFAEGRLDEDEFDQRVRGALTARTHAELGALLADLPAAAAPAPAASGVGDRFAIAHKGFAQRRGRWRVPERFTAAAYKGECVVDLRAAELPGPVTTILALAYKGDVEIIVPPGVRVELHGFGLKGGRVDHDWEGEPVAGGPVVHVRGFAYGGTVEALTREPRRQLPGAR